MRSKNRIVDETGLPMTYAEAADLLGIYVQSLRNLLYRHRAELDDIVTVQDLDMLCIHARNDLYTSAGRRISYKKAAKELNVSVSALYRIVRGLRERDLLASPRADIKWSVLTDHIFEVLDDYGYPTGKYQIRFPEDEYLLKPDPNTKT
jgi:predicted DNA-binding protein (UPF0251 family)